MMPLISVRIKAVQAQQVAQKAAQETEKAAKPKKGNKLHAEKVNLTMPDGTLMHFDSKREANRYAELKLLERAGEISDLKLQVPFELIPKQPGERSVKYIADFVYLEGGKSVVEDVKGKKTRDYIIKRKLMLWRHGITIKEV